LQQHGFKAVKHQGFVGTSYFDAVQNTVTIGKSSTTAMKDSTETAVLKYYAQKKHDSKWNRAFL
jgi:isocitrate lyase